MSATLPAPPACWACRDGSRHTRTAHRTFRLQSATAALDGLDADTLERLNADPGDRA